MSGLPRPALALLVDWPPELLARLAEPDQRAVRRRALGGSPSAFREALRDAGWRRGEIRAWLVTGEPPVPRRKARP